jgi:hypothetical protein
MRYRLFVAKDLIGIVGLQAAAAFDREAPQAFEKFLANLSKTRSYIEEAPHVHEESNCKTVL